MNDFTCMRRVEQAWGFCIIQAKAGMNPQSAEAFERWR